MVHYSLHRVCVVATRLINDLLNLRIFLIKEVVIIRHYALPILLHYHLARDVTEASRSRHPWLGLLIDTNGLVVDLDWVM
jgi:hypothetical protein